MHDIDRTTLEYGESSEAYEGSAEAEEGAVIRGPLNEADEMELAAELLGVTNEQELEQFLGGLFKKVGQAIRSPLGKAVTGVLKTHAGNAIPQLGGVIGGHFFGEPGAQAGTKLGSLVKDRIGWEAESEEEREFEGARQFVRFAAGTVKRAAATPGNGNGNSVGIARAAANAAAKQYAPALLGPSQGAAATPARASASSGRWIRRGTKIVLLNV